MLRFEADREPEPAQQRDFQSSVSAFANFFADAQAEAGAADAADREGLRSTSARTGAKAAGAGKGAAKEPQPQGASLPPTSEILSSLAASRGAQAAQPQGQQAAADKSRYVTVDTETRELTDEELVRFLSSGIFGKGLSSSSKR